MRHDPDKTRLIIGIVVCSALIHNVALALLPLPAGLEPGEKYHLVFNSSSFNDATSTEITVYNQRVQAVAESAGIGSDQGVDWFAIASTDSKHARDNAVVGENTPVYNMNLDMVASGFDDMWDGAVNNSLAWDERGQANNIDAWTGSDTDGTAALGLTLGNSNEKAWCGRPTFMGAQWINFATPSTFMPLHLFGLSEELTVAAEIAGDFNGDELVDSLDIDLMRSAVTSGTRDSRYDLDGAGDANTADEQDFDFLLTDILASGRGDGNLDSTINFNDFVILTNHFGAADTSWAQGNFNLDNTTNFEDFVELTNRFDQNCPCPSVAVVPEPASVMLLLAALLSRTDFLICPAKSRSAMHARTD